LPAPFAQIALRLGVTENVVLRSLETLRREGKIARVGAVFAPRRIGASTLAALAVPPDRLAAVAATVNRFPEVNHNYEREHAYNLWFVVTAGSEDRLRAALAAIEQAADCRLLRLPLVREYHIDLGFALHGDDSARKTVVAQRPFDTAMPPLSEVERRLVMALQEGLPLFFRPFAVLASRVGCEEDEVIERLRHWCANGVIKRFGVVVRHRELGYTANAMLVHDVPDEAVDEVGERLAREAGVSLCYRRPRVLPQWRYNLFCMIHGRERVDVERKIVELRRRLGLKDFPHAVLFSLTRFKQGGARYV
jgi:DNA-binding Lrp family transcriptional regulator